GGHRLVGDLRSIVDRIHADGNGYLVAGELVVRGAGGIARIRDLELETVGTVVIEIRRVGDISGTAGEGRTGLQQRAVTGQLQRAMVRRCRDGEGQIIGGRLLVLTAQGDGLGSGSVLIDVETAGIGRGRRLVVDRIDAD